MKYKLVHSDGSRRLLLIFAGWGMDHHVLGHIRRPGYDVMVVWDYRSFHIDWSCVAPYDEICLIAWSMGVYAASEAVQAIEPKITRRVAINGTMNPVDDRLGIPVDIFEGTLTALSEATLRKFNRRMCADRDTFARFEACAPSRGIDELRDELRAIADRQLLHTPSHMRWDVAVIGRADRIFPADNQQRAWQQAGTDIRFVDDGHYFDFQPIADTYVIDKSLVQTRFEAGTATYDDNAAVQIDLVERMMAMLRELHLDSAVTAAGNTILEIGSGSGMLTRRVARLVSDAHMHVWDLSAPMPRDLPRHVRYTFENCDAELAITRLAPASVDAIFSASTIQWFNSPARFLRDCARVLRPGGLAIISTYTDGNLHEISDITGHSLPLPDADGWCAMAARDFVIVGEQHYRRDLDFNSPLDVLRHLKLTGVNALSQPGRGALDARMVISRYPMMLDGRYHLTYKPIILILKKR